MQDLGEQCQCRDQSEMMRELAGKIWRVPIAKIREGMRQANIQGITKILQVYTPVGPINLIFLTSSSKIGIMMKGTGPNYFYWEFRVADFVLQENQGKELNTIAKMSCDWG